MVYGGAATRRVHQGDHHRLALEARKLGLISNYCPNHDGSEVGDRQYCRRALPGMDGFEVLDRVSSTWLPIVVFVTAYDRYALKAFDSHALDYLLKPFTRDRFRAAVQRARAAFANAGDASAQRGLVTLLNDRSRPATDQGKKYLVRFAVKRHRGMRLARVRDIDYIQAGGNYAEIHATGGTHPVRMTMRELEQRLDPSMFVRIHRSAIAQIDRIRKIVTASHGDFDLTLYDGTVLRLRTEVPRGGCSSRCNRPGSASNARPRRRDTRSRHPTGVLQLAPTKSVTDVVSGKPWGCIGVGVC
jgi:two-component system LytT family response regulator